MSIKSNIASGSTSSDLSIAELMAEAKAAKVSGESTTTNKSLNTGSMADVDEAIKAGSMVVKYQCNFKRDSSLGVNSPMKSFSGSLKCKNTGDSAFMDVRPMGYSNNNVTGEKEYITDGTMTAMYNLTSKEEWDDVAFMEASGREAAAVRMAAVYLKQTKEINMNYLKWQALFSSINVSGEGVINFNHDNWDRKFVTEMSAKSSAGKVKSFVMYFVLQDAVMKDHGIVFRPRAAGVEVEGRTLFVTPIFVEFNETTIRGAIKGTKLEGATVKEALNVLIELDEMEKEMKTVSVQHEQIGNRLGGKKAVQNAHIAFEAGLADGKWNFAIERKLQEFAASGLFNKTQTENFFCTIAANFYFYKKKAAFDGQFIDDEVNVKAIANSVKEETKANVETTTPARTRRSAV
jgi:hypothetical protein